uniref:Uncharacterized protein n=2 Tax=Clastoptera arizonana TaxID=38151 RepID=A0A1B6C285_9HEMI
MARNNSNDDDSNNLTSQQVSYCQNSKLKIVKISCDSDDIFNNYNTSETDVFNKKDNIVNKNVRDNNDSFDIRKFKKRKLDLTEMKYFQNNSNTALKISKFNDDSFITKDVKNSNENIKKRKSHISLKSAKTQNSEEDRNIIKETQEIKRKKEKKKSLKESKSLALFSPEKGLEACSFDDKVGKSEYVENLIEEVIEDSILSQDDIEALKSLEIVINWDLPTSHKLDTGSHNLSKMKPAIEEALKAEGLEWKQKMYYSKEECEQIQQNWEEFSEIYGFKDPRTFFQSKEYVKYCKYTQRLNFKRFLAKGLPDRPLYSVYHKFLDLYAYPKKGPWNEKEDIILSAIYNSDITESILKKRIVLCKVLERNWMSVYRRIQYLQGPIMWDSDLMVTLLENLLTATKSKNIKKLKKKEIDHSIWVEISDKMNLPAIQLKRFWCEQFYTQLYATKPIYKNYLRIELIEWFHKTPYKSYDDFSWKEISKRFYNVGMLFLYYLFQKMVIKYVPSKIHSNFRETINHLYEYFLPTLKEGHSIPEQQLVRLKYCPEQHTLVDIDDYRAKILEERKKARANVKKNFKEKNKINLKEKLRSFIREESNHGEELEINSNSTNNDFIFKKIEVEKCFKQYTNDSAVKKINLTKKHKKRNHHKLNAEDSKSKINMSDEDNSSNVINNDLAHYSKTSYVCDNDVQPVENNTPQQCNESYSHNKIKEINDCINNESGNIINELSQVDNCSTESLDQNILSKTIENYDSESIFKKSMNDIVNNKSKYENIVKCNENDYRNEFITGSLKSVLSKEENKCNILIKKKKKIPHNNVHNKEEVKDKKCESVNENYKSDFREEYKSLAVERPDNEDRLEETTKKPKLKNVKKNKVIGRINKSESNTLYSTSELLKEKKIFECRYNK